MMIPINETTLKVLPVTKRAQMTPMKPERNGEHDQKRVEQGSKLGGKNHVDEKDGEGQSKDEFPEGLLLLETGPFKTHGELFWNLHL